MGDAFVAKNMLVYGTLNEPGYTLIIDIDSNGYPVMGYFAKNLVCYGWSCLLVNKNVVSLKLR